MSDPWTRPRTLLESVMADGLSAHREAIHEALRRISVLEGQRDAANECANGLHAMLSAEAEKVKALEAERDQLRAEVEALRSAVLDERERLAKFFDLNDTNLFWGSQAAHHIRTSAIDAARKQQ